MSAERKYIETKDFQEWKVKKKGSEKNFQRSLACVVAEVVEYVIIWKSSVPFCYHRAVLNPGLLRSDIKT